MTPRRTSVMCVLSVVALAAGVVPGLSGTASAAAVPTFAVGSASLVEGDSSTRVAYLPVTLSDRATTQVTVQYTATADSATAGVDFKTKSGTLVFKPATASGLTPVRKFVPITVYSDTAVEGTETFTLSLSNPTGGAALGSFVGTGTIHDDDSGSGVRVSAGDAAINEGDSGLNRPANVAVTLSQPATAQVSVGYTLTVGTAGAGSDVKVKSGTLIFTPAAGSGLTPVTKTVSAIVYPDLDDEGAETAFLTLTSVSGGGASLFRSAGTLTILDDDGSSTDADGDRLSDSIETNTGIFLGVGNTGTDPNNPDTDGDAIPDGDEVLGTLAGLDLPAMGTSPIKRNILLEFDWFDDANECGAHSHRPTANAISGFEAAFANAPTANPDGSTGIDVISDYGQGGAFTGGNLIADADGVIAGGVFNSDYTGYKSANLAANRNDYFHYVLMPHRYNTNSGSSGQAAIFGDDLIVSLYCFGSDGNVRNTIMHELGHNLNLRHGGNVDTNYKPNYNSVMNYAYQFPGVDNNCTPPGDGVLDYSRGTRVTLNENSLNENLGTCGAGFPWDWNGNATIQSSVVFDVNTDSTFSVLTDYNDWANITFEGLAGANAGNRVSAPELVTEQPVPFESR